MAAVRWCPAPSALLAVKLPHHLAQTSPPMWGTTDCWKPSGRETLLKSNWLDTSWRDERWDAQRGCRYTSPGNRSTYLSVFCVLWQVAVKIIDKTQLNPTSLQKVRKVWIQSVCTFWGKTGSERFMDWGPELSWYSLVWVMDQTPMTCGAASGLMRLMFVS